MNKEELLKAIMELPKAETNNHISAMNGINVGDLMSAVDRLNKIPDYNDLLKENQELKQKYEMQKDSNKLLCKAITCDDCNCSVCEAHKENIELKKQLEEYDRNLFFTKNELDMRQKSIDNKLNQQKEFIKYLENEINICDGFLDTVKSDLQEIPYGAISVNKTYITTQIKENEIAHKVYEEILQKYKNIIGVLDED